MKRIFISLFAAAAICTCFAACKSNTNDKPEASNNNTQSTVSEGAVDINKNNGAVTDRNGIIGDDDTPAEDSRGSLASKAGDAVGDLGQDVGSAVEDIGDGVGSAVEDIGDGVGGAIGDIGDGVGNAADDIGEGAGSAVEDIGNGVGSAAGDMGNSTSRSESSGANR